MFFMNCWDNLSFAFVPIWFMSQAVLINISIWLNFVLSSYLLINNFIALLRHVRRCIFFLLVLSTLLFVVVPLGILLVFAC